MFTEGTAVCLARREVEWRRSVEMPDWMRLSDEIGPECILHVSDPTVGMKGVVVVDTTVFGRASGGTRMLPDITTEEIAWLARAMTHKYASLDAQLGGAKGGIWFDPTIRGEQRDAVLRAYGKAVKPLLTAGTVRLGADMGTDARDTELIREGAGLLPSRGSALPREQGEEPIGDQATAYGVVVAARAACEFAGMELKGARVAIEGFGKVGGCAARLFFDEGANVVALSTIHGTVYDEKGLDVVKLLDARRQRGDQGVQEYPDAEHVNREALYTLPVDVLVPGARPHVINEDNVHQVQASVISSLANVPVSDEALETLFRRGIHFVPDFISNMGWFVPWLVSAVGGTTDDVFEGVRQLMTPLARNILADSRKEGISPRALAVMRNNEKMLRLRTGKQAPLPLDQFVQLYRERLKI
jgi:glutamate dehydrogenase (NAD(P)+)